ncbi:MAG TPA: hypothetical protein VHZ96_00300 [Frankiaceae bacterium]|nr:hypothetical protein [Frankiaceae bacterium]
MNRRVVAAAAAAAIVVAGSSAYGASITFTTPHLGATALPAPKFYPNSVVAANVLTSHQIANGDTLTVVYSEEMQASSLCTGAATQIGSISTGTAFTVTINNNTGSTGNDVLSINSIPTTDCTDGVLRFGTVDLGSAGYVTTAASFTTSTVTLTQTATTATIVFTLNGRTGTFATVASGAAAVYTPNPALTDTAARSIASSTAVTTATVQF